MYVSVQIKVVLQSEHSQLQTEINKKDFILCFFQLFPPTLKGNHSTFRLVLCVLFNLLLVESTRRHPSMFPAPFAQNLICEIHACN